MQKQELVQLSKTMSYALRHNPADFGLSLDGEGWVMVQDLLAALRLRRSAWQDLCEDDFAAVIAQSDKQRFEMSDGKIRAYYGHSVAEKMVKESVTPPEILFHGTTPQAAHLIKVEGLKPMKRQYVHLSAEQKTALEVARRRTQSPVILRVSALHASEQGIKFYLGNDMVWLADAIPPAFLVLD